MQPEEPIDQSQVTRLLERAQGGDPTAEEELLPLVYKELRSLARAIFSDQKAGHTLQPTAIVHEAYLKLVGNMSAMEGRRQFFIVAGKAMRQIMTDHARRRDAVKRGGGQGKVTFHPDLIPANGGTIDLVALDDSLSRFASINKRGAQVVELRLFSGFTVEEAAEIMGISARVVDREWSLGRAWLQTELAD